jgi:hypothetical protein
MQNNMQKQDFYEIYDYYSQPLLEKRSVQISLFAVMTVAIVAGVFLYVSSKRRKRQLTYWELAFQALENLKLEKCVSKNEFKIFYFKLTEIFKKYIEKRYGWKVENKTDEELLILLEKQNFHRDLLSQVQKILAGALWIKFANQEALKIQAEADLKTIIDIIDQTKQVEQK